MLKSANLKITVSGILPLAFLSMAACSMPKTAEEFRKAAPSAMFGKTKTVEAKRPYGMLSAMFKRKAKECLNGEVVTSECGKYGCSNVVNKVQTQVNQSKNKTELVTYYKMGGAVIGQPDEGYIFVVADVLPAAGGKSQLDFYYGAGARIVEAIQVWAEGDERGCPDLTRIMERS